VSVTEKKTSPSAMCMASHVTRKAFGGSCTLQWSAPGRRVATIGHVTCSCFSLACPCHTTIKTSRAGMCRGIYLAESSLYIRTDLCTCMTSRTRGRDPFAAVLSLFRPRLANANNCIAIIYYGPYMHQCLLLIFLMPTSGKAFQSRAPSESYHRYEPGRWDHQRNKARLDCCSLLRILR
jgi:hypothetical protein